MTRRLIAILVFATVAGLFASVGVYRVLARYQTAAQDLENNAEDVVVAAVNMQLGETVTARHVKLMSWPKGAIPSGALRTVSNAEGRIVRSSIVAGEPLLEARLAPSLAGRGGVMPMLVPEGLRAVTIKVDDAIKETGFILPGSHVDVVVSMPRPGMVQRVAKLILQDVVVLAAGQTVEMRDNKPVQVTTVTLALTPEQTERLALAQSDGRVTLTTRNFTDKKLVRTPGVTPASLLGNAGPAPSTRPRAIARPAARPQAPETYVVSIIRSGKPSEHVFVRDAAHGGEWTDAAGAKK
jgi:pilus assembly protein CpaB